MYVVVLSQCSNMDQNITIWMMRRCRIVVLVVVQFITFHIFVSCITTTLKFLPTATPFVMLYDVKLNTELRRNAKVATAICRFGIYDNCKKISMPRIQRTVTDGSVTLVRSTSDSTESTFTSVSADRDNAQLSEYCNAADVPFLEKDDDDCCNDLNARSMFGTKAYWDDVYNGRGDFPADTYSWYTNWNELQRYIKPYASARGTVQSGMTTTTAASRSQCILIPGIGNESLLIDMISAGYNQHHTLVVQDYSHHAIERQIELLQSIGCSNYKYFDEDAFIANARNENDISDSALSNDTKMIELYCCDITKKLPSMWDRRFDIIIEKGLLDAVYLSDDTNKNLQGATHNLHESLKSNGVLISISSVIPNELRHVSFPSEEDITPCWEWIRDGSTDATKAGCFIIRKIQ